MKILINYCEMCGGYSHHAKQAALELEKFMGLKVELTDVGRGRFEVIANGVEVFSKAEAGRFPKPRELVKLLKQRNR